MQPFTKAQNKGMYDLYITRYRQANILKFYGLTWTQFMDLPTTSPTSCWRMPRWRRKNWLRV
jgi:hypothetical protein